MAVQLKALLELDILSGFRLVAGSTGLNVPVEKVGILDYEVGEIIDENFAPGEFVLTNLLVIKDNLNALDDVVRRLIKSGASALAIKTVYLDSIPDEVKAVADSNDFPIFLYDVVFYEDIITELVDYIRMCDELSVKKDALLRLHEEALTSAEVSELAYTINEGFKDRVAVIRLSPYRVGVDSDDWRMRVLKLQEASGFLGRSNWCLEFDGTVYLITTCHEAPIEPSCLEKVLELLDLKLDDIRAGLSRIHGLEYLNRALIEARTAHSYQLMVGGTGLRHVENTGLYQMLIPICDNYWVEAYYKKIIHRLEAYDEKNGSDLIKTACIYTESGCDVKLTAERMYQHGNTIRYRLDRIRTLLEDVVDRTYLDQELAVVMRLYALKHQESQRH